MRSVGFDVWGVMRGVHCVRCDAKDSMRGIDLCEVRCAGCDALDAMCVRYKACDAMCGMRCEGCDALDSMYVMWCVGCDV